MWCSLWIFIIPSLVNELHPCTELMMRNLVIMEPCPCTIDRMLSDWSPKVCWCQFLCSLEVVRVLSIVMNNTPHLHMVCNPKSCSSTASAGPLIIFEIIQHYLFNVRITNTWANFWPITSEWASRLKIVFRKQALDESGRLSASGLPSINFSR